MANLLLAAALLVPLAMAPGVSLFFDVTPKVAVLLILTGAAAIRFAIAPRGVPAEARWFAALLGLQLLSLIAATVFSDRPELSIAGTNWRRFGLIPQSAVLGFAFLVAVSGAATREKLLRAMAAAGMLAAVYGSAQYFGVDPFLDAAGYRVGEGEWMIVRPPSTLGHANYAAVVYLAGVFAGASILGSARGLGMAAIAAGIVAIVLGGSRAALLGLAAGGAMLLFTRGFRRRHAWIAAASLAALAIFYVTPPGQRLRARVRWFVEDPRGGARLLLWQGTVAMAAERPLTGWGPETFTGVFAKRRPEQLSAAFPDFYDESAHNIFLDTLASQGIPGLVILSAIAVHAIRSPLMVSLLVVLQFSALTIPTALAFYTAAALGRPAAQPAGRLAAARLFAIPAALWLVFAAALVSWDLGLRQTDRLIAAGQSPPVPDSLFGFSADLWHSRRLFAQAQYSPPALQQAVASARRATESAEDRQNAWYHLATLYALTNDATQTEAALRQAIAEAPQWFKPRWTLARLLLLTGRREEAAREAALAAKLSGGKLPEVMETLSQTNQK